MKAITIIFSASVVGIVVCLGMSIYTAVQNHKIEAQPPRANIPVPAVVTGNH